MRRPSGQLLWYVTGSIAFLSLLLFASGFAFALNPQLLAPGKPAAQQDDALEPRQPADANNQLLVVALGDSLTRGTGDVNGQGYVGLFRAAYQERTNQPIQLHNLAINGLTSEKLLAQLTQKHVQEQIASADLILMTIGGNDLFRISEGLYELDEQRIEEAITELEQNFTAILDKLRASNKHALIIYTALYNPFGDTEASPLTTPPLLKWNSKAEQIAAQYDKVIVVPTYDLFSEKEATYLYSDHFHPNSAGYARIAERVLQAVD